MPITTSLDEKTGLRTYDVTGETTPADFKDTVSAIYDQPDYVPASSSLWDLRKATDSSFSVLGLRAIVDAVSTHRMETMGSRVALVVRTSRVFGLARMFEQMMKARTPVEVMVFRDRDEAEIWAKGGKEE